MPKNIFRRLKSLAEMGYRGSRQIVRLKYTKEKHACQFQELCVMRRTASILIRYLGE